MQKINYTEGAPEGSASAVSSCTVRLPSTRQQVCPPHDGASERLRFLYCLFGPFAKLDQTMFASIEAAATPIAERAPGPYLVASILA